MAIKRPFPSFLIYKDNQGHWRWNFAAKNGKVVAASSVAYLQRPGCIRAIQMLKGSGQVPVVGRPRDMKAAETPPPSNDEAAKSVSKKSGETAKPKAG